MSFCFLYRGGGGEGGLLPAQGLVVLRIIGYNIVCVVNCFHSIKEHLWLKDV